MLEVSATSTQFYIINGAVNPSLSLVRGQAYIFRVNAAGHPFLIKTQPGSGTVGTYSDGVVGNGVAVGDVVFTVPLSAPSELYYACQFHALMTGTITITDRTHLCHTFT